MLKWLFMLCCNILVPIVMIIVGLMMWKYPSKNLYKKIMQNYDITEEQMKK